VFVLLPFFALLTSIAWRGKQPRYPAHLYLALHLHAAWFGALAVMTILTGFTSSSAALSTSGILVGVYVVWYGLVALRRVFGESWLRTIGKAAMIGVMYSAFLFAVSLLILGYAIAMT
jgi:hypothetical protein